MYVKLHIYYQYWAPIPSPQSVKSLHQDIVSKTSDLGNCTLLRKNNSSNAAAYMTVIRRKREKSCNFQSSTFLSLVLIPKDFSLQHGAKIKACITWILLINPQTYQFILQVKDCAVIQEKIIAEYLIKLFFNINHSWIKRGRKRRNLNWQNKDKRLFFKANHILSDYNDGSAQCR